MPEQYQKGKRRAMAAKNIGFTIAVLVREQLSVVSMEYMDIRQ